MLRSLRIPIDHSMMEAESVILCGGRQMTANSTAESGSEEGGMHGANKRGWLKQLPISEAMTLS